MNADRTVLTDVMWTRVEPMLPGKATDPGVTTADNRQFLRSGTPSPSRQSSGPAMRYPTPRSLKIHFGSAASSPSLRRRLRT